MKSGVILVMSCNEERFIEEEEIIRKTWGSPIINGEIENLSMIFYRGGSDESFDDEKKVLYLNVPDDLKRKYFTKIGNSYQIADEIKRCVTFKEHNLLKDTYPSDYDFILCRNVVIYFTDEAKDMIYRNFYKSLKNHGVLFIGSTEQITNYKDIGFKRMSSFYFEKDLNQ